MCALILLLGVFVYGVIFSVVVGDTFVVTDYGHVGEENSKGFLDEWTLVVEGGEMVARLVAAEFGYDYGGTVRGFDNTYKFLRYEHSKARRTVPTTSNASNALLNDQRISWAQQQFIKSRSKRGFLPSITSYKLYLEPLQRVKRIDDDVSPMSWRRLFNDELWSREWYLQGTTDDFLLRDLEDRADTIYGHLNVLPAYAKGYNGRGVRVCVLDDGLEYNHTDLRDNYDPEISWDCNDNDPDPSPRYELNAHGSDKNSHGTRCAGEIAMSANNRKCGVGVAWAAKIGGIRMLDGSVTDLVEGMAFMHAWNKTDIYSASWGPNDDGRTVEGPGHFARMAMKRAITKGRDGKGVIYVWANGNGGHLDNCNCDGYASSIYTISIGSVKRHGKFPWYGEICTSTLAAAYSSDNRDEQKIATTDTRDSCTLNHTGTSAAAPLAAGVLALVLQANPKLTWRDVQHLVVWTSQCRPLADNPGWQVNGAGLLFNPRFGFGLINAASLVSTALTWTNVPDKDTCVKHSAFYSDWTTLSPEEPFKLSFVVKDCPINYLEHVELVVNIEYSRRGDLEVFLWSPQGTKTQLLTTRLNDDSTAGFVNWPLVSVATWGESPRGWWWIKIEDKSSKRNHGRVGPLHLIIHGTKDKPAHMQEPMVPTTVDESDYSPIEGSDVYADVQLK